MENKLTLWVLGLLLLIASCKNGTDDVMQTGKNYPAYGGNKAGNRYSPLQQINVQNVHQLQPVWQYFANEKPDTTGGKPPRTRETQCQPIVVNGILQYPVVITTRSI